MYLYNPMKNSIIDYVVRQSLQPDFISIFVNLFYFIRSGLFKGIVKNRVYRYIWSYCF